MANEAKRVLLAHKWDQSVDPTGYWISEKLDGVRAYWTGSSFFSRQGNKFYAPDWYTKGLPKCALDGELWVGRGQFQKCISIVKSQKSSTADDWIFVTYLCFDAPQHGGVYEDRVKFLQDNIDTMDPLCYAAPVGVQLCIGLSHMNQLLDRVLARGGEGLMLRKPKSLYEHCRSKTLLKVKTFHDEEAKVVGHKKGKNRLTGLCGGLQCVLPNGIMFVVGSGLTDKQRGRPPKVGSIITFKYQEVSNSGTPRFPTFLRARPDLSWDDVCNNAKTKTPFSQLKKQVSTLKLQKQHSILFSTVPSRDQSTGNKLITDEDEDLADTEPEDNVSSSKQWCKYGDLCYRQDKKHLDMYKHTNTVLKRVDKKEQKVAEEHKVKPACRWGSRCYQTNDYHRENYTHPDNEPDEAINDTDEAINDTDEAINDTDEAINDTDEASSDDNDFEDDDFVYDNDPDAIIPNNDKKTPSSPIKKTPSSPIKKTPGSPVRKTPGSPVRKTPSSPVKKTPNNRNFTSKAAGSPVVKPNCSTTRTSAEIHSDEKNPSTKKQRITH